MAATLYTGLIQAARFHMRAARGNPGDSTYKTDAYWSDDELFNIAKRGTTDLWGAIIDLHEEHYLTVDTTNVTLQPSSTQLSGVPADCFRVYLIEPTDPTLTYCQFYPRPYNHPDFINARNQMTSPTVLVTPSAGLTIYYDVTGVGTPNAPPVILTAPQLSSAVALRFVYVPNLGVGSYQLTTATNPIPGESDNALIAWIVSFALGKERQDKNPDPGWLSVYQTEKQSLLVRLKPRQEQEATYADAVFYR